jgi:glucose/arabinose dehydrogenase
MQYKSQFQRLFAAASLALVLSACGNNDKTPDTTTAAGTAGLTLPEGFGAQLVADSVGQARHIVVNDAGDIYVKLNEVKDGKGILVISDKNKDGKADEITGFGNYGGTGITIKNGYLYASSNTSVFRYKLDAQGKVSDTEHPDTLVYGLIDRNQHNSKSIVLDDSGHIYVNIGAFSNICQVQDRSKGSPGMNPCPILDSAGGIWRFSADSLRQTYGKGIRYATGLRNVVGLDWNKDDNSLYVMQHGRDNLHDFYPEIYDTVTGIQLPAEAMFKLHLGADCGWPYVYYDQFQKKKLVSPEYGGDGRMQCSSIPEACSRRNISMVHL